VLRVLEVVIPSAGATLFFVIVLRALVQADRRERVAAARMERERTSPGSAEGTGGDGYPGP